MPPRKSAKPKFDNEIFGRTMSGAMIVGALCSETKWGKDLGITPLLGAAIGAILGPIYDEVAFRIKTAIAARKDYGPPDTP